MKDGPPQSDGTREDFLTARQLASILQVSESTVRRLAREGRIPAVRITPRILRFNLKSVRHALDATARTPAARRQSHESPRDDSQLSFIDLLQT